MADDRVRESISDVVMVDKSRVVDSVAKSCICESCYVVDPNLPVKGNIFRVVDYVPGMDTASVVETDEYGRPVGTPRQEHLVVVLQSKLYHPMTLPDAWKPEARRKGLLRRLYELMFSF